MSASLVPVLAFGLAYLLLPARAHAFQEGPSAPKPRKNVLGGPLEACCHAPKTGFTRSGYCSFTPQDRGAHLVCAVVTEEFLAFSKARGNDLTTPHPQYDFPGLKPGDKWCLCAARWQEALEAKVAPQVVLAATDEAALQILHLKDLQAHAHPQGSDPSST